MVQTGAPVSSIDSITPPEAFTRYPTNWSAGLVVISTRETEQMLGRASPRNPRVLIENSSEKVVILLVACLSSARSLSSLSIPDPLSRNLISRLPPSSILMSTLSAPASILLSSNSLATEAGLSITSPAAIWLATCSDSILILPIIPYYQIHHQDYFFTFAEKHWIVLKINITKIW